MASKAPSVRPRMLADVRTSIRVRSLQHRRAASAGSLRPQHPRQVQVPVAGGAVRVARQLQPTTGTTWQLRRPATGAAVLGTRAFRSRLLDVEVDLAESLERLAGQQAERLAVARRFLQQVIAADPLLGPILERVRAEYDRAVQGGDDLDRRVVDEMSMAKLLSMNDGLKAALARHRREAADKDGKLAQLTARCEILELEKEQLKEEVIDLRQTIEASLPTGRQARLAQGPGAATSNDADLERTGRYCQVDLVALDDADRGASRNVVRHQTMITVDGLKAIERTVATLESEKVAMEAATGEAVKVLTKAGAQYDTLTASWQARHAAVFDKAAGPRSGEATDAAGAAEVPGAHAASLRTPGAPERAHPADAPGASPSHVVS